ncbi:ribonuclease H-like YkuK family protein [Brevibacillus dissolubilis]|uniref:ribonuclease H-like YkuK family protein n=1 Tax=Brevibacillus dissolubilis TaxID=1844116 RepID=UPI0011179723|nr:ribonuclease H-like YkuK family protein [Brevibacillus dissolubilis]
MEKEEVFAEICRAVSEGSHEFEIVVGADSQVRNKGTYFVIAVSLIRISQGGTFFYHQFKERHLSSLRERIYMEAFHAVGLACELREHLKEQGIVLPIRLHFDIGPNGPTNKFVQMLLKLAKANDFEAFIKPFSFGASTIADKFTR